MFVTFAPSQLQAQSSLGARTHGIIPRVLILKKSLISLGELKMQESTALAAWLEILDFAKQVSWVMNFLQIPCLVSMNSTLVISPLKKFAATIMD